jgi:hypothetical protein
MSANHSPIFDRIQKLDHKLVGIAKRYAADTFATLSTENGAPTRLVQLAGRWKDIRMVETYTRTLQPEKIKPFSVMNNIMGVDRPQPEAE